MGRRCRTAEDGDLRVSRASGAGLTEPAAPKRADADVGAMPGTVHPTSPPDRVSNLPPTPGRTPSCFRNLEP